MDSLNDAEFKAQRAAEADALLNAEYNANVMKAKANNHAWAYNLDYDEPNGDFVRHYRLVYHHADDTIEIFDRQRGMLEFFKRDHYPAINPTNLKIGGTVHIWKRALKVMSYADRFTKEYMDPSHESAVEMFKRPMPGITHNGHQVPPPPPQGMPHRLPPAAAAAATTATPTGAATGAAPTVLCGMDG